MNLDFSSRKVSAKGQNIPNLLRVYMIKKIKIKFLWGGVAVNETRR